MPLFLFLPRGTVHKQSAPVTIPVKHKPTDLPSPLPVIGWREWLEIPALGIAHIKAKVDTGARTSSLHTYRLDLYDGEGGKRRVHFHVHPFPGHDDTVECDFPVASCRMVRNSGGQEEERPFIHVPIAAGPHVWEIEMSLTNRESMKFHMLLGRSAVAGRFQIDPGQSYLLAPRFRH